MAASWTACWNFIRSRLSSSTVSVPTIERSEPSRTFLTIESTSSSLRLEEAFGGVADGLVVGADLERGDALDRDLDALPGHGIGQVHVDLAGGQLELADLVDEGQDDDAAAAHDLEVLAPVGPLVALAGDDERLVRAGDLVATADVADDEDDDDDDEEDREHPATDEVEQSVKHLSLHRSLPRVRPAVIAFDDEPGAGHARHPGDGRRPGCRCWRWRENSWVWPSALTRTLP